ncbi:MAG: hypothetical protein ACYCZX_12610 [Rhodospirillaceae bacterium]
MANARRWTLDMIALSPMRPLAPEIIWESLEKYAGRGPLGVGRCRDLLDHIDGQLIERRGGPAMRALWQTVADYLDRVQQSLAA